MGKKENYTTDSGVELTQPQVQVMREFVGLGSKWIRKFTWSKEEFEKKLTPFFNGNSQEDWTNIVTKSWPQPTESELISKRKDIRNAVISCLQHTSTCILIGLIIFDSKEIAKLKVHQEFNCRELLYGILKAVDKGAQDTEDFDEDYRKEMKGATNTFFAKWREELYDTIKTNWRILKTYETDKKILEKVTQLITPLDPRLLDGKVLLTKGGKFKFKDPEDQHSEYKQSMFSPNLSMIKQMEETNLKTYSRLKVGKKNSLINEVLSSVCAFLNTNDGDLYIGVADKRRQIVGLSDDRNSEEFKKELTYEEFQEKYKKKILQLMKKRIKHFDPSYVDGIGYPANYGEDDNVDGIDVLHIPCRKIPSNLPPVYLINKLNDNGNKIKQKEILYKREDESDYEVQEKDKMKFYHTYFRPWMKQVFPSI